MRTASGEYATALADVALATGHPETLREEVRWFADLAAQSADLRNFMDTPAIARASKHDLLEKLVARAGATNELRNFLFVLVDHHRTQLLPEIAREFETVLLGRMGIAEASITSARELSEAQKQKLSGTLESVTGMKIEARYTVDQALVGGLVVRIGSTIYDGSVRAQLQQMAASLSSE